MLRNHPRTVLILLAGGKSSRAEEIKGLRKVHNIYWIDIVLKHYLNLGLSESFIGLGYNNDQYLDKSFCLNNSTFKTNYSINQNPANGSFSTLQTILNKALASQWDFALILHIDSALATKKTIEILLKESKHSVVKPIYRGKSGHPIKLSRKLCENLVLKPKNSQLDEEMRKINKSQIFWKKVNDDTIHINLNTKESWIDYLKRGI